MNSPDWFIVAARANGPRAIHFEGLITIICVSGISRKSKLLQRLIGIRRGAPSCPEAATIELTSRPDVWDVGIELASNSEEWAGAYPRTTNTQDLRPAS